MRKIIAITHLTLDGVMQAPGGPAEDPTGGFSQGGWAMGAADPAVGEALREIMARDFALLLGRRTYEIFAAYWPYAGDHFIAHAFNRATKYVVTRTLDRLEWMNSQPLRGDAVEAVRQLKMSEGPELHLWGSGQLLQVLIAADLVDEFRIWLYPVIVGGGKRLFESAVPPRSFVLVESRHGRNGVLLNTYRPGGSIAARTPAPEAPSTAELARRQKWAAEENLR